jgi:hypothetical protein
LGGLAILSKLTAIAFFAACVAAALVVYLARRRPGLGELVSSGRKIAGPIGLGFVVLALTVWAGYRFSVGVSSLSKLVLPAPELFNGIAMVLDKTSKGHPSYLLGTISQTGFWYYYPVALAVKLPLAFIVLTGYGLSLCWKKADARQWLPVSFTIGLLGFELWSTINIGIRHVMPVMMFWSVAAAAGMLALWGREGQWRRRLGMVLLAWLILSPALAHPDYLPYFNALAGEEPEKILDDSDLDWGQDMKRLAARLREVGARQVYFNPLMVGHLEAVHGFPPITPANAAEPEPGWTAVSITVLKTTRLGLFNDAPDVDPWPNRIKPMERVGKGVYLYHFAAQRPAGAR